MPRIVRNGVAIAFESRGEGPAIVFHTGAGGDRRIWGQAGYLDRLHGFQHVLIDQRGRGESGRPDSIGSHAVGEYVEDIAAVLDGLGIAACGFWGYSRGVLAGIAFGARYPGRMRALVGTGSLPNYNLDELPPLDPEAAIARDVEAGGVRAHLDEFQREEGDRFPEEIDRNVRAGDPRMHALDYVAWRAWHGPRAVYPTIAYPVLMLTGEKEDADRATESSVAAIARGRVVRVPGLGHLSTFYRSDVTVPLALPFLRDHRS